MLPCIALHRILFLTSHYVVLSLIILTDKSQPPAQKHCSNVRAVNKVSVPMEKKTENKQRKEVKKEEVKEEENKRKKKKTEN